MKDKQQVKTEIETIVNELDMLGLLRLLDCANALAEHKFKK